MVRQDVVEHDDERVRLSFPRHPALIMEQSCLGNSQEIGQIFCGQVAGSPNHEDSTVQILPLELLHRGLLFEANARIILELLFHLLYCDRTLIEEINDAVRIDQKVFGEPAVSATHVECSEL